MVPSKRKKYKLLTCKNCNNSFNHWRYNKYCSLKCSAKAKEKKVNLICHHCKIEYKGTPTVAKYSKYCSKECFDYVQGRRNFKCANCNKDFKGRLARSLKVKNVFCCKKCADKFNRGKNHYEYKPLIHLKHDGYKLDRWSIEIKQRDKYKCARCGCENKYELESHHIKEIANFPELKFNIDNGITLCISCHAEVHKDKPKLYNFILSKYKRININNG